MNIQRLVYTVLAMIILMTDMFRLMARTLKPRNLNISSALARPGSKKSSVDSSLKLLANSTVQQLLSAAAQSGMISL